MSLVDYSDSDPEVDEAAEVKPDNQSDTSSLLDVSCHFDKSAKHTPLTSEAQSIELAKPNKHRLPPPPLPKVTNSLSSIYRAAEPSVDEHGRVRSFPHVEGNFPGYFFIETGHVDGLGEAARDIISHARDVLGAGRPLHAIPAEELHLSLSRTFALRRHHIDPLVSALRDRLPAASHRFSLALRSGRIYSNDDATRTFVGLRVVDPEPLRPLIAAIDAALAAYRQPAYYHELDAHVSVAWSPGGPPSSPPPPLPSPPVLVDVARVRARIGARTYTFDLPLPAALGPPSNPPPRS